MKFLKIGKVYTLLAELLHHIKDEKVLDILNKKRNPEAMVNMA